MYLIFRQYQQQLHRCLLLLFLECNCLQQFHSFLWWAVILFKLNSFDGSLKPHYSLHEAKWTVIDTSCRRLVRGGWEVSGLPRRGFIFLLLSYSHSAHTDFNDVTLWPFRLWKYKKKPSRANKSRGDLKAGRGVMEGKKHWNCHQSSCEEEK